MYGSGTPFLQETLKCKNEWKIMVEKQTAAKKEIPYTQLPLSVNSVRWSYLSEYAIISELVVW